MPQIDVSLPELISCAQDLNAALSTYRSAVDQAHAAADALSAKWKGAARDAFVEEQEKAYRWHGLLEQMVDGLIANLRDAAAQYASTESSVRNSIR